MTMENSAYNYIAPCALGVFALTYLTNEIVIYWVGKRFPHFATLPEHIRRHGAMLMVKALTGIPSVIITCTFAGFLLAKGRDDYINEFFLTTAYVGTFSIAFDTADLSLRRKFSSDIVVHHIIQLFWLLLSIFYYTEPIPVLICLIASFHRCAVLPFGVEYCLERDEWKSRAAFRSTLYGVAFICIVLGTLSAWVTISIYLAKHWDEIPVLLRWMTIVTVPLFKIMDLSSEKETWNRWRQDITSDNHKDVEKMES